MKRSFEEVRKQILDVSPWFENVLGYYKDFMGEVKSVDKIDELLEYVASTPEDVQYIFYSALKNGVDAENIPEKFWLIFDKSCDDVKDELTGDDDEFDDTYFYKQYDFYTEIMNRDGFPGSDPWTEKEKIDNKVSSTKKDYEESPWKKSPILEKVLRKDVISAMAEKAAIETYLKDLKKPTDNDVDKYADLYAKGKAPKKFTQWMDSMKQKGYF